MSACGCSQLLCWWKDVSCNPILKVKQTFTVPACDTPIIIVVSKTDAPVIGMNFYIPFVGFFEVTNYDKITGLATIVNNCVEGNADPGTEVLFNTKFYISPPPVASPADFTLEVGTGCDAPGVTNAIQEASYTGGVLKIIGRPEHFLRGNDSYQAGMDIPTYIVTPQFDITLVEGTTEIGPVVQATIYPDTTCRYISYQSIADLTFNIHNVNAQGNGLTVTIEKTLDGGTTWIPIAREFRWLNPSDLLTSMNMHRAFIDGFDPALISPLPMQFRVTFESSSDNTDSVLIENVVLTNSMIIITTDPNY